MSKRYSIAVSKGDIGYKVVAPNIKDMTALLKMVVEALEEAKE